MTFRPRPSRTTIFGRGLLFSRQYPRNWHFIKCFSFNSYRAPRVPTPVRSEARYGSSAGQIPPLPEQNDDGNLTGWVEALEQYLGDGNTGSSEAKHEQQQCQSIIRVLGQARATDNVDLLAHFAFRLKRWDTVHSIVNRLLDNIASSSRAHPTPNDVPSNINWRALGVKNWGSPGILDQIVTNQFFEAPQFPISGDGRRTLANLEAAIEGRSLNDEKDDSTIQTETLQELWQSLGNFVLEAADLTERRSMAAMEHVYQILARFQQLDLIPHSVYNDTRNDGTPPSRSRAGIPFLQSRIMHVLADSTLEASMKDSALDSGLRLFQRRFKILRRELGLGIWLEYILWCCIESGFVREGTWILGRMSQRSKAWHFRSWGKLLRSTGQLDIRRTEYFDTWDECGENAKETKFFMSRSAFVGMGERTVTTEVVFALMDGYLNRTDINLPDQKHSLLGASTGIKYLRSILKRDGLYLSPADVNYLLSRSVESQGVLADHDPHSLFTYLDIFPYTPAGEECDWFSDATPRRSTAIDLGHSASTLALGLHAYALNISASQGHILGMLHTFETLVGALGAERVRNMRRFAMEDRHIIKAVSATRKTEEYRQILLGENAHNTLVDEILSSILMWPVSLSLLLDALTVSRSYRFGNWLLLSDGTSNAMIPPTLFSHPMLSPSIIRFAAATSNRHIFSTITDSLQPPIPRETLRIMVTYQLENLSFDHATTLLGYLPRKHQLHWGASNVASIAAVIIKLEHKSGLEGQKTPLDHTEEHLERAKDILVQILQGTFSRRVSPAERTYVYQEQELYQLHRILGSISGSVSDVCRQVELEWKGSSSPPANVPANAFHHILSAVTDTRGCVAGKELWDFWCIDPFSSLAQEIRTGPNAVFQSLDNIPFRTPGTATVPEVIKSGTHESGNLVVPNLNTVRIISMSAIEQQMSIWRGYVPESDDATTKKSVSSVLLWCIRMFERFGLTEDEIDSEMESHLARIRKENATHDIQNI